MLYLLEKKVFSFQSTVFEDKFGELWNSTVSKERLKFACKLSNISFFFEWAIANICYQGLKACVNKCPAALICWAPIVLGCRPQWQLHQATSCFWCMRPRELLIFSCWLALNISLLWHCHPQLHQATSCCKRAHVSGAWCMSATGLYIFSRWFDMLKYPPVRKSAHVSGAYVHYYFKVILMLMVSARHPPITWVTTWVRGKRLRISNFNFWQTFWK